MRRIYVGIGAAEDGIAIETIQSTDLTRVNLAQSVLQGALLILQTISTLTHLVHAQVPAAPQQGRDDGGRCEWPEPDKRKTSGVSV